ncbi:MAG: sugar phosphate nucleotidyltransferase, partial [Candidatus Omnitrophota bacterium]
PKNIDVVILCGGLGERLSSVTKNNIPKTMVKIDNQPFLDIIIHRIASFGFKRFILCIGHKGAVIEDYYKKDKTGIKIVFSSENESLGTGGAVKNARSFIESDSFLVLNGDSFCGIDFKGFAGFHFRQQALISIALTRAKEQDDAGIVFLDAEGKVSCFSEKTIGHIGQKSGYVNAGVYFFGQEVFSYMIKNKFSLEYDFFPGLAGGKFYGYIIDEEFIDIGTPQRYESAKRRLKS